MKKFDPNYELLADMYGDSYYPTFLVDKIKFQLQEVIKVLEQGETDVNTIQNQFDQTVLAINDLQEEFDENNSELETVARESIGESVHYILQWFNIPIDTEEAMRERDW